MRFKTLSAAVLLGVVALAAVDARAQDRSRFSRSGLRPYDRPTVSPYLNLLGGSGRSFESEYLNIVRPQAQFYRSDSQLRRSVRDLRRQTQHSLRRLQSEKSQVTPTGQAAGFMTDNGAYQNLRGFYPAARLSRGR